jgi:hypothetical protein
MSGSYGLIGDTTVSWASSAGLEGTPAGGVTERSWSLRYQTVDASGNMTVTTIPCGATTPDICDTLAGSNKGHAQYQPNQTWGKAKINAGFTPFTVNVTGVKPGANASYVEPQTTALMGITLKNASGVVDPNATWPVCGGCVGVAKGQTCKCADGSTHSVANEATWVDADGDKSNGVTLLAVPGGGIGIDGTYPDPPIVYGATSECPRTGANPGTEGYAALPGAYIQSVIPLVINTFSTYEWHAASRLISKLASSSVTLTNNECVIKGNVTGPGANGMIQTDARMDSCETCTAYDTTGNCTPGTACNAQELNFYDGAAQNQTVNGAKFMLCKVTTDLSTILTNEAALNTACNQLRTAYQTATTCQ